MNVTLWNSTEEGSIHFLYGVISIFIHGYALVLCLAIFDYQDEKPKEEKNLFDVLIKDQMSIAIFIAYAIGITQIISLFTPPLTCNIIYWVSYCGIFLGHFYCASMLVTVYIKHVFIFQPDDIIDIKESDLKWKSRVSKLILTLICMLISYALPNGELQPPVFQWLTKDKIIYNRYLFMEI